MPTTASDAFTAAIIIWQLLAGRHPFASALDDGAEPGAYRERVLAGRSDFGPSAPKFVGGVAAPDLLRRLLMAALSPDPAKRPTATDLHAALLEARRGGGPPRHPLPVPPHSPPVTPSSRLVLTGSTGSFSTGGRFAVTRTTLRRMVGDDARYAGDSPQFMVERGGKGGWLVLPPPEPPRNPTFHNGVPLTEPVFLAAGDTISIGPSKTLCRVSFESFSF